MGKVWENKIDRFIKRKVMPTTYCKHCNSTVLKTNSKHFYGYCPQCKENVFEDETYNGAYCDRQKVSEILKEIENKNSV